MSDFDKLVVMLEVYAHAFPGEDAAKRFPVNLMAPKMYGPLTRACRQFALTRATTSCLLLGQ